MAKMIGILADVSIKRQTQIRDGKLVDQQWGRFVFKCIENLIIPETTTKDDLVFAIGYGTSAHDSGTFDLLSTIKKETEETKKVSTQQSRNVDKRGLIEGSLSILEKNGAKFVRKWLPVDVMMEVVSQPDTVLLFSRLQSDKTFLKAFVADCLPRICRDSKVFARLIGSASVMAIGAGLYVVSPAGLVIGAVAACASGIMYFFDIPYTPARPGIKLCKVVANAAKKVFVGLAGCRATKNDIRELVAKAKSYMFLVDSSVEVTPYSVQSVSDILQLRVHGDESAAYERARRLDEVVEPVISEERPLFKALAQASKRFFEQRNTNRRKLLFVISGGSPTDLSSALEERIEKMKQTGVCIVCCFISTEFIQHPKRLYKAEQDDWKSAAKLMFYYSSTVNLDKLPPTLSRQNRWFIDSETDQTKAFLRVDHLCLGDPDLLGAFCSLARNTVSDHDAFASLPFCKSEEDALSQYINICTVVFGPKKQEGGTCYANATAAVVHLATRRIVGRDGGYPEFSEVLKKIIEQYGMHGADTQKVLREVCPRYRLRFMPVELQAAWSAVALGRRPVIARFRLTDGEWESFSNFYMNNPTGILSKNEINIHSRLREEPTTGHAVVFSKLPVNGECMVFMNSWGTTFADKGFFRVRSAYVLGFEFFDVFWYVSDLSSREKKKWNASMEVLRAGMATTPTCRRFTQELPRALLEGAVKNVGCLG